MYVCRGQRLKHESYQRNHIARYIRLTWPGWWGQRERPEQVPPQPVLRGVPRWGHSPYVPQKQKNQTIFRPSLQRLSLPQVSQLFN